MRQWRPTARTWWLLAAVGLSVFIAGAGLAAGSAELLGQGVALTFVALVGLALSSFPDLAPGVRWPLLVAAGVTAVVAVNLLGAGAVGTGAFGPLGLLVAVGVLTAAVRVPPRARRWWPVAVVAVLLTAAYALGLRDTARWADGADPGGFLGAVWLPAVVAVVAGVVAVIAARRGRGGWIAGGGAALIGWAALMLAERAAADRWWLVHRDDHIRSDGAGSAFLEPGLRVDGYGAEAVAVAVAVGPGGADPASAALVALLGTAVVIAGCLWSHRAAGRTG